MLVLAFDTTAAACSVALVRDGARLAHGRDIMEQGQAEALLPLIGRIMADANVAYADLDRIAVTIGPGSFTGVRVGLATARALGLAAGKPVIGVSSLEVVAAAVPPAEREMDTVLAAIDTKRGELYVQLFDARTTAPQGDPIALPPTQIPQWLGETKVIVAGDGAYEAVKYLPGARLSAADPLPDAVLLARLASTRRAEATGPLPLYVLPPKITLAPDGGRLRPVPENKDGRLRPAPDLTDGRLRP